MYQRERLNLTDLKARGWTKSMVRKLLGAPEKSVRNPFGGPDINYWPLSRVAEIEKTPEFTKLLEAARKRSTKAKQVADARRQALLNRVEAMPISVMKILPQELLLNALASYNAIQVERGASNFASADSSPEFLDRIQLNYVRHELTRYDYHLAAVAGGIGVEEARDLIRDRVLEAIERVYPFLGNTIREYRERKTDDKKQRYDVGRIAGGRP